WWLGYPPGWGPRYRWVGVGVGRARVRRVGRGGGRGGGAMELGGARGGGQALVEGLEGPYGERHALGELLERVTVLLAERYAERIEELKLLDLERSLRPDWFQDPGTIGYV